MPLRKTTVKGKTKNSSWKISTAGLVDLHFHGAFGIDLMTSPQADLDQMSLKLAQAGIAGFCPTTLSTSAPLLLQACERLGKWIRAFKRPGARPLGIHLEGPFIHPLACGAHPPNSTRPFNRNELLSLWNASQHTLKILTMAPEILSDGDLEFVTEWAGKNGVVLSAGHSRANLRQAQRAFKAGFQGVTHAWNALAIHHRDAGILGAALGRPRIHLELILDQIHVSPEVLQWTQKLHPDSGICWISDCAPAAESPGKTYPFGPLQIEFKEGACRTLDGKLAGGGRLLSHCVADWVEVQGAQPDLLKKTVEQASQIPLRVLGLKSTDLPKIRIQWIQDPSTRRIRYHSTF